jgi:hypothetical protein
MKLKTILSIALFGLAASTVMAQAIVTPLARTVSTWTGGFGDFPPNLAHSQKTAFPLVRGC